MDAEADACDCPFDRQMQIAQSGHQVCRPTTIHIVKLSISLNFSYRYAPHQRPPSDEGVVTEGDWGRENYPSVTLLA